MHVGIPNPRWRGKRSRHSRRMRNPKIYVSGNRPIQEANLDACSLLVSLACWMYFCETWIKSYDRVLSSKYYNKLIFCKISITGLFSPKYSQKTVHSSPIRARHGCLSWVHKVFCILLLSLSSHVTNICLKCVIRQLNHMSSQLICHCSTLKHQRLLRLYMCIGCK